jgi:hypothetical protein
MSHSFAAVPASSSAPTPWTQVESEFLAHADSLAHEATMERWAARALEVLVSRIHCQRASLSVVDPTTGRLHLWGSVGGPETRVGQDITRPRSVSEWVVREGRGLVLQGQVRTSKIEGTADNRVQSSMSIPLRSGGVLGVLSLARGGESPAFAEGEAEPATSALAPLAESLARRHRVERAQRFAAGLEESTSRPERPWRARPLAARHYAIATAHRPAWDAGGGFASHAVHSSGGAVLLAAVTSATGAAAAEQCAFLEGAFQAAAVHFEAVEALAARLDRVWNTRFEPGTCCAIWLAHLGSAGLVESCALGSRSLHLVPIGDTPVQPAGMPQPALGEVRDGTPHAQRHRLLPGDALIFTSDSLAEVADAGGQPFGFERLIEGLEEDRARPLEERVQSMCDRSLAHGGRTWWRQDLLAVGLQSRREDW